MKYLICLTLIFSQCLLFLSETEPAEQNSEHFLFVENPKYFFGSVKRGNKVNHIFKLENKSLKKVIISEIKRLPNCEIKESLPIEIIPGDTYDLKVSLDTSGSQGVCKTVLTLSGEYPVNYEKSLFISGKILSDIKIFPQVVSFDNVYKGRACGKTVSLSSNGGFEPDIKRIVSSSEFINTVFNLKNRSDKKFFIDVILSPHAPLGDIDEEIIITTNEKIDPERRVKVTGKVIGDVDIEPENLNFGMVNGKNSEKIINVKPYKGFFLDIIKIGSRNGMVTTKLVTIKKGKEYMILVKPVEPKDDYYLIDDILEIHTNSGLQPVIQVKVAGSFSEDYAGHDD